MYLDVANVEINYYIFQTRTIIQNRSTLFWHLLSLASSVVDIFNTVCIKAVTLQEAVLQASTLLGICRGTTLTKAQTDHAISVQLSLRPFLRSEGGPKSSKLYVYDSWTHTTDNSS